MDIMVVDSMAGAITAVASMVVVTTVGAITVVAFMAVVVMAIVVVDLNMKASAPTVASMAVKVSMVVVDFMEADSMEVAEAFMVVEADSMEAAVSTVVVAATAAGIASCLES
jgi:hypothetical protein